MTVSSFYFIFFFLRGRMGMGVGGGLGCVGGWRGVAGGKIAAKGCNFASSIIKTHLITGIYYFSIRFKHSFFNV